MSIKIVSRKPGFRRAGIAHPPVAVYADDHFSPEQLAQLEAEPLLSVTRIDDGKADDKGKSAAKPASGK